MNTRDAIAGFVAPCRDQAEAVVEATHNWTVVYDLLAEQLKAVHLAHPLKVRAIAETTVKTDSIHSKILAHLLRCGRSISSLPFSNALERATSL